MVYQEGEQAAPEIVMLCRAEEAGKSKCYQYKKQGGSRTYGCLQVVNKKVENTDKFAVYILEVMPEGFSNSLIATLYGYPDCLDRAPLTSPMAVFRMLKNELTRAAGPSEGISIFANTSAMALNKLFVSALAISFVIFVEGTLTGHFRKWLDETYGPDIGARLERSERYRLIGGSFGGKKDDGNVIKNQPVVFIHGTTLSAQSFLPHRQYFMERGYTEAELYATTYGDAGRTPFFSKPMNCEDVQQVRQFITAVHEQVYTSLLVLFLDTYVGVAGVAYGMERCPETMKACNNVSGMICSSKYIQDVNSQSKRYEGATSYAIYSKDDTLVGQKCCDHPCSELKNANLTVIRQRFDHITAFTMTKDIQFGLVSHNSVDIRKL
ncbi:lipase (class 2) domain-containing protein [Ditylenchus destructor]|uniref:Lipase (Class 2) domain-containing protein n=1 Tax=Ditylenchus destructor TaxID=166010 RepID=A0AAD4N042_9BILA|nr:lipase (class 2) domain-containing protein [Ditylenchus destructor]